MLDSPTFSNARKISPSRRSAAGAQKRSYFKYALRQATSYSNDAASLHSAHSSGGDLTRVRLAVNSVMPTRFARLDPTPSDAQENPRRGSAVSERRLVLAEHVLHRPTYLTQRAAVFERLPQGGEQVIGHIGSAPHFL